MTMELKYNKSTDSEHKIKLDSKLIYAAWKTGVARAGHPAALEVATSFVGNGAKIKIKGKSENGEMLGKINGKIKNNLFVGKFDIPDDIELDDQVYFKVDISANGLSGESDRIPTAPSVTVTNMKWSANEARRGDILKLTADVEGCYDDTEGTIFIYEYDQDNIHDKIAELPMVVKGGKIEVEWEYQYHEDVDEIPTDEELKKYGKSYNPPEYFFVIDIDGQKFGKEQESGLLTFKDWMEISLTDFSGAPMLKERYILHLPDGTQRAGSLDDEGYSREEDIPPGKVTIEFPDLEYADKLDTDE